MVSEELFSPTQLSALSAIERTCSVLSLLGSLFVIVTFICSKAFHKPINRLVFYASFGNVMTNVGTLMSRSYIESQNSVGCQLQGFLIQMFLPADALWTLAMAINVYLTFYYKFDARGLRRMEIPYLVCCYGIPFVPAFAYIFIKNSHGQRVYGNAVLWCWVSSPWDIFRIASFYGPIWVVLLVTFFIYLRAGHTIYLKRKELDNFSSTDRDLTAAGADILTTIKTTEVSVTTEFVVDKNDAIGMQPISRRGPNANNPNEASGAYSVHITADGQSSHTEDMVLPIPTHHPSEQQQQQRSTFTTNNPSSGTRLGTGLHKRNRELSKAAWSYTKCSLLFFTAILITWIPSSANRVYSVVHNRGTSVPLEFMSAFVLPLQGFWNCLIYTVTSWTAVKNFIDDLRIGDRPEITELVPDMAPHRTAHHLPTVATFRSTMRPKTYETESMTELANSRPHSDDGHRTDSG